MKKSEIINNRKAIGKMIAEARKSKGLSQSKLAMIADVDRTTISKIEHGSWSFGIDMLINLANHLDIDVINYYQINPKNK